MARFCTRRLAAALALAGSVVVTRGVIAAEPGDVPGEPTDTSATGPVGRAPVAALRSGLEIDLPSARPAGDPNVDRIRLRYFPTPQARVAARLPAVILVPPIGSSDNDPLMRQAARYFAARGVSAAVLTLPYHGERWPDGQGRADPGGFFLSPDVRRVVASFEQSVSDVETVVTWLEQRPEVDRSRVGLVGISLGAIITHLVMGRDSRIGAGVALLGGGGLTDIYQSSLLAQMERALHPAPDAPTLSPDKLRAAVRAIDPLTYAAANQPRHVLMVAAARDVVIPPREVTRLWKALGEPPIQWVDANHFALGFTAPFAMRTSLAYLQSVWAPGDAPPDNRLPGVYAPTIKFGVLAQRGDLGITPALQWQFHSFARRRDHLSRIHTDFGISPRGTFLALGLTGGAYLDIGLASRVRLGHEFETPRPYLSLHVTF